MKRPRDMIRAKKYKRCGCGFHGVHNKPRWSNVWRIRNAVRKLRIVKSKTKEKEIIRTIDPLTGQLLPEELDKLQERRLYREKFLLRHNIGEEE